MGKAKKDRLEREDTMLEIYSLGQFMVKRGEINLSKTSHKSYRLWNLFKYFLTHRNKPIPTDTLQEAIWPEDEDLTQQALRTLIYRLRKVLAHDPSLPSQQFIIFAQGGYSWNKNSEYWLDVEEFENLYNKGLKTSQKNPYEAINYFKKALEYYKGDFLPDINYFDWVIPLRNYYRRIYLDIVFQLKKLLTQRGRYDEIIKISEKALLIEPFEENLHQYYIESLLNEGKDKDALSHYEYVTSLFYRELGVKPSPELRSLYRRIKSNNEGVEMDLNSIQENLEERNLEQSAFCCDPDTFRFFYKLEGRRLLRTGKVVFLGLLTLTNPDYTLPPEKDLKEAMAKLQETLKRSLRRGDVICQWNEAQYLLILPHLNLEQAEMVLKRIKNSYENENTNRKILIRSKIEPIQPHEQETNI